MSLPHVEQFIDMLIGIPAEGYENSFVYVMSEWTRQQGKHASHLLLLQFYRHFTGDNAIILATHL